MGGKKGSEVGAFRGAGNVFHADGGVAPRACGIV